MDDERWQRIDALFHRAAACEPRDRASLLDTACGDDRSLRDEVESLLAADGQAHFTSSSNYDDGLRLLAAGSELTGRHIGSYRVIREIGHGGMGTVYLAVRDDETFEKQVAIKLIPLGLDSAQIVGRFRGERQILASLDHPNITRLLDGGTTDDGLPYFVMEYIDGEPIDRYCESRRFGVVQRLELFQRVCAAVQYAHQHLVIHRDIKPANVLVTADGVPRLLDFGIAKLLGPDPTDEPAGFATATAARFLTPIYASPEQVRGEPVTVASDIYSLGVLLYELLTGRLPYDVNRASAIDVARAVCEREPEKPSAIIARQTEVYGIASSKVSRQLRGDLDAISAKALRKERALRYGSVEQLAEDIRRHLEGLPVQAHAGNWAYRTRKLVRRYRAPIAALVVVTLSLVGGVVATTRQARIARAERARAERQFADVRNLTTSFLFEFHSAIQNLPGATPARKLIVQRALEYLKRLSEEARGDRRLQLDIAEAYLKVGDVQGNPYAANLGDVQGAAASYNLALESSAAVVQRDHGDMEARNYLGRSHRALADVLAQLGRPSEALLNFREAIAAFEAIRAANPLDARAIEELAACYQEYGDLQGHNGLQNVGDPAGAIQSYQKSIALYEALSRRNPADRTARRGIALLQIRIGDMDEIRDDLAGALVAYRSALTMAAALSAEDPTNGEDLRRLALAHRKAGGIEEDLRNYREALAEYGEASAINERLMNADPTNVQASMGYVITLRWTGDLLKSTGESEAALAKYRRVLEILDRLSRTQAGNVTVQQRLAEMLIVAGKTMVELGSPGEGRQLTMRGLAMSRELAAGREATPDDLSQYAIGFLTCEPADLREPVTALRLARASVEQSGGTDSGNLDILAQAYFANGDVARAIQTEERAISLLAPLRPDQPDPPTRRRLEAQLARFKEAAQKKFPAPNTRLPN